MGELTNNCNSLFSSIPDDMECGGCIDHPRSSAQWREMLNAGQKMPEESSLGRWRLKGEPERRWSKMSLLLLIPNFTSFLRKMIILWHIISDACNQMWPFNTRCDLGETTRRGEIRSVSAFSLSIFLIGSDVHRKTHNKKFVFSKQFLEKFAQYFKFF